MYAQTEHFRRLQVAKCFMPFFNWLFKVADCLAFTCKSVICENNAKKKKTHAEFRRENCNFDRFVAPFLPLLRNRQRGDEVVTPLPVAAVFVYFYASYNWYTHRTVIAVLNRRPPLLIRYSENIKNRCQGIKRTSGDWVDGNFCKFFRAAKCSEEETTDKNIVSLDLDVNPVSHLLLTRIKNDDHFERSIRIKGVASW